MQILILHPKIHCIRIYTIGNLIVHVLYAVVLILLYQLQPSRMYVSRCKNMKYTCKNKNDITFESNLSKFFFSVKINWKEQILNRVVFL